MQRWTRINAACWRFSESRESLAIGAVFLERDEYRAYFNRRDLGLFPSLEKACEAVEAASKEARKLYGSSSNSPGDGRR